MGNRKSTVDVQAHVELLSLLIYDTYNILGLHARSAARDIRTLRERVNAEGFSFMSKTLPKLGKSIDRGLETGHFVNGDFKPVRDGKIPRFLGDVLLGLYSVDGCLLDGNSMSDLGPEKGDEQPLGRQVESLRCLRQICYFYYKTDVGHSPKAEQRVIENFRKTDAGLPDVIELDDVLWHASLLLEELFKDFDPRDIVPRHGPGAVATRERANEKYLFKRKYLSLHAKFPYYDYFLVGMGREIGDRLTWYKGLQTDVEPSAKVCLVPKDSRGPRLISMEPLEIQWIQQGLLQKLVRHIETHPLTRGRVNFTDQSINQGLALSSSLNREWATLDLKDASDRVSCALVNAIFPDHILEYFYAARSTSTLLPDGSLLGLNKFAPMGSALCFPVLALTLWSITKGVLNARITDGTASGYGAFEQHLDPRGCEPNRSRPSCGRGVDCYVYGDDLVIPTHTFQRVSVKLGEYHLQVNGDKSFAAGSFRESCGVDAFHGLDVTPFRVKTSLFGGIKTFDRFRSLLLGYNTLVGRGFFLAAERMLEEARGYPGRVPYGIATSGYPCVVVKSPRLADALNMSEGIPWRWNADYQRVEFKVWAQRPYMDTSPLDGWNRLLRQQVAPTESDPTKVVRVGHTLGCRVWSVV